MKFVDNSGKYGPEWCDDFMSNVTVKADDGSVWVDPGGECPASARCHRWVFRPRHVL